MNERMVEGIDFTDADDAMKERIAREWGEGGEVAARHMHLTDGFSIAAMCAGQPVGLIAIVWREIPTPVPAAVEGFIDIIEVRGGFRRRGIARAMIEIAAQRVAAHGACQLRAWSSADKIEAIPMWKALGFGLAPVYSGEEVAGFCATRVL